MNKTIAENKNIKYYQFRKYKNGGVFIKSFDDINKANTYAKTHDCEIVKEIKFKEV